MTPERARFEAAYAAHARAVLAFAMRRADPDTAHDVLSETFLVAWRRIDELPAEPLAWLLGTARKVLANQRRAADRRGALHERIVAERPATAAGLRGDRAAAPADVLGADDAADGPVLEALARLSESDREALLLVAWDDLAPGDAAKVLGIRPAAFTMRLSRARRRLATELERADTAMTRKEVSHGR